jgi:hypothetical protein
MGINGVLDQFTAACSIEERKFVEQNTIEQLAALRKQSPELAAQDKFAEALLHLSK